MNLDAISQQLQQKQEQIGQQYKDLPAMQSQMQASLFGNDNTLSSLRDNQAAKIKELYSADKGLAIAQQGGPAGFIDDPSSVAKYGSSVLANRAGELADIQKGIANRRDVLGNALTKAVEGIKLSIEAATKEHDMLQQQWQNELDKEKFQKSGSGGSGGGSSVTNDLMNAILGLQADQKTYAPSKSGVTSTKATDSKSRSALVSRIQAQNPGKKLSLTYNKDGTIAYQVLNDKQQFATPERGAALSDPDVIKKLSAAAIAGGAQNTDVANILQLLGITGGGLNKPAADATTSSSDPMSLLGGSASGDSGMIRVKNLQTGQVGSMPAANFDSSKYAKI